MLTDDLFDLPFQWFDQIVKSLDHGQVGFDCRTHRRIFKPFGNALRLNLREMFLLNRDYHRNNKTLKLVLC